MMEPLEAVKNLDAFGTDNPHAQVVYSKEYADLRIWVVGTKIASKSIWADIFSQPLAATDSDGEKMTVTRVSGNIAGPIFGYFSGPCSLYLGEISVTI